MPLYEYICTDCECRFDKLRGFSQADAPAECPQCHGQHARRALSLFASVVHSEGGGSEEVHSHGSGCSCGGCASHNCATCGH